MSETLTQNPEGAHPPLQLSNAARQKIQELVSRYPRKQAALIPALFVAQDEFGWLKPDVMALVAHELELPLATVLSTAMFYTMLHKKPVGRYHVQICVNVACYLSGSDAVLEAARNVLGIEPGETTTDGLFTLEEVQCLCACDRAPVLQVNKTDYFNVTPESMRAELAKLQTEGLRLGAPRGWPLASERGHHA